MRKRATGHMARFTPSKSAEIRHHPAAQSATRVHAVGSEKYRSQRIVLRGRDDGIRVEGCGRGYPNTVVER
jgi:hypothetical protein